MPAQQAQMQQTATEPIFGRATGLTAPTQPAQPAFGAATETDSETDHPSSRPGLSDKERMDTINALLEAPENNAQMIHGALGKSIPADCEITYRGVLAAIHPDRFTNPEEKDKVDTAFKSKKYLMKLGNL